METSDEEHHPNGWKHQMKSITTVTLRELALPNAASGWVKGRYKNPITVNIVGIFLGCCCVLGLLGLCLALSRSDYTGHVVMVISVIVIPVIVLPYLIPRAIESSKKMNRVDFNVSDATLTQFNLSSTSSSTLIYNLSLAVTIGPNGKKKGVYYDKLEAAAYYQGQNLTSLVLSPVYLQGRQRYGVRTVILRPVFQGQRVMTVLAGGKGLNKFRKETAANLYGIVVKLSYSGIRTDDYDYDYNYSSSAANQTLAKATRHQTFDLKVPMLSGVASAAANVYGFARQHGFNLLLVFLIYVSLCF